LHVVIYNTLALLLAGITCLASLYIHFVGIKKFKIFTTAGF